MKPHLQYVWKDAVLLGAVFSRDCQWINWPLLCSDAGYNVSLKPELGEITLAYHRARKNSGKATGRKKAR